MVNKDIHVESRELPSREEDVEEDGQWGHAKGSGVPMSELGRAGDEIAER